jgi:KUP system potassium uptake protein
MNGAPDPVSSTDARSRFFRLTLGAIGVVYGDIGTSPLYAVRECFSAHSGIMPTPDNVLGLLSLVFWSLIIVISIKYITFVLRADHRGEGGVLALMTLVAPRGSRTTALGRWVVPTGLFAAALLYGDGMITPAISVLSAVEGLSVATPVFEPFLVPIAVVILIGIFVVQRFGTAAVGAVFGPIVVLWFSTLFALGLYRVLDAPQVLQALSPWPAIRFMIENRFAGFIALGAVFLSVTGGEALYADMGHFGKRPIRVAWFILVLPGLMMNYLGQGALLLTNPEAARNPFFLMAPSWALYPLVLMATMATVIASQAVISGAFSLTRQALQLGYCPRLEVRHSSAHEIGQVYVPHVNWALLVSTIGLVIGFRTSSNLAGAYGVAVSLTMVLTTVLIFVCARERWGWSLWKAGSLTAAFLVVDLAFLGSNLLKVGHGGWFPLMVAAVIYLLMITWRDGRTMLAEKLKKEDLPFDLFIRDIEKKKMPRVPGAAVFMSSAPMGIPRTLGHNVKHNKILHERVTLMTVVTEEVPRVAPEDRVHAEQLQHGFTRMIVHYGFMEQPDVPAALAQAAERGIEYKPLETTFFLGRETIVLGPSKEMAEWRKRLYSFMARNAEEATKHYNIPINRVVELGIQIAL